MNEIQQRALAVRNTLKRFDGRAFDWRRAATCIHLARFHARQMGHKVPTVPRFKSALTARRALKETGHDSLPALFDSMFQRIPPAMMRTGDLMCLPGDADFDAVVIRASVNKFIGWHEDADGLTIIDADMNAATGAWRL